MANAGKLNCCRYFSWPFFIWIAVFLVVYLYEIRQSYTSLNKKCNYNETNYALPIDITNCFGFFSFDGNGCDSICVNKCPEKSQDIRVIKIVDQVNETLARQLLTSNNMCQPDVDLNNLTINYIIEKKICASKVDKSTPNSSFFPGLCFPLSYSSLPNTYILKDLIDKKKLNQSNFPELNEIKANSINYQIFDVIQKVSNFFKTISWSIILILSIVYGFLIFFPFFLISIFSCIVDCFRYGFCSGDLYDTEVTAKKLEEETEDIKNKRQLLKYLYPIIISIILFISFCVFNAVFMFKLENEINTAKDVIVIHDWSALNFNGVEKYLWIAFAILAFLALPIIIIIVILLYKMNEPYSFTMEADYIRSALIHEMNSIKQKDYFKPFDKKDNSCIFFSYLTFSILLEISVSVGQLVLKYVLIIQLLSYLYHVWLLNTNWFFKFCLVWYGKITYNILNNLIESFSIYINCTWTCLVQEKIENDENDRILMCHKSLSKIKIFFVNVLFKNLFNCIEFAFFDMSSVLIFSFGMDFSFNINKL